MFEARGGNKTEKIEEVQAPEERKNEKTVRQFYVLPHLLAGLGCILGCL